MRKYVFAIAVLLFSVCAHLPGAYAGPLFCLGAPGMKPQCIFYSAKACRDKRQSLSGGSCSLNEKQIKVPEGIGRWCLVTSTRHVECVYDNYRTCNLQENTKDGICVRSRNPIPVSKEFESIFEKNL